MQTRMASNQENAVAKRARVSTPSDSSSSTEAGKCSITGEAGPDSMIAVMRDFVKALESQNKSTKSKLILHPSDNTVPKFDPEDHNNSIGQWCRRIDELARLHSWDDGATVYHAISRRSGLASTWYGSLETIDYTCEQWKEKLTAAFPPKQDYAGYLREMMDRRKTANETYLAYYYEKLVLINRSRIYGTDAVSCLLDGISDPIVSSAARASDYQTCEALLTFLRTCDVSGARRSHEEIGSPRRCI